MECAGISDFLENFLKLFQTRTDDERVFLQLFPLVKKGSR